MLCHFEGYGAEFKLILTLEGLDHYYGPAVKVSACEDLIISGILAQVQLTLCPVSLQTSQKLFLWSLNT